MTQSSTFSFAKVGLVLAKDDRYAPYYRETLEHSGIPHEVIDNLSKVDLKEFSVLLLCGQGRLEANQQEAILNWNHLGGSLVCSGSSWGLDEWLKIRPAKSDGYPANELLVPLNPTDRLWPKGAKKLRFFGGAYKEAEKGAEIVASTSSGCAALTRAKHGQGKAFFFGADVGQTFSLMQLGHSVECDGIGPNDGSVRLGDGILRAEDATNLSFEHDRLALEDSGPFFDIAHADGIKEIWIRMVVEAAEAAGQRLFLIWHWPQNAEVVACVSVDCEEFEIVHVETILKHLSMVGMPAAWLVGQPGYPLDVYRALLKRDHEIGLLFNPENGWGDERMKVQHVTLSRTAGTPKLSTVRAANGRWYGRQQIYQMAEAAGAKAVLARGGRQPGSQGFLFGTSHPFFPLKRDGAPHHAGDLPYTVCDPGRTAPDSVMSHLLKEATSRYGCFHMAYASEWAQDNSSSAGLWRTLGMLRQAHALYMLPGEILRFEKTRRAIRVRTNAQDNWGSILMIPDTKLENLTVMVTGPAGFFATGQGANVPLRPVQRYGTNFHAMVVDLEGKAQFELMLKEQGRKAA